MDSIEEVLSEWFKKCNDIPPDSLLLRIYNIILSITPSELNKCGLGYILSNEDIQGDVFCKLISNNYKNIRSYNPKISSFETWLRKVVRNHIFNIYRQNKRIVYVENLELNKYLNKSYKIEFNDEYEEMSLSLRNVMKYMSKSDIYLLNLLTNPTLDKAEIAKYLGCKASSLRWRRYRIIKKTRNTIRRLEI